MTALDSEVITHLDEDWDFPCDYAAMGGWWDTQPHAKVEWTVRVGGQCGHERTRLTCTNCKDVLLHSPEGVHCGVCHFVSVPARMALISIQRFSRGPA